MSNLSSSIEDPISPQKLDPRMTTTASNLESLPCGQSARIEGMTVEAELHARLSALGLRRGKSIEVVRRALLGGPLHVRVGNAAAVATGVAAGMRVKGRPEVRALAQGGDGGTTDIGFGCLSGMFERNDDVLYICYDNQAYMNTGVQRSGATPPAARTNTSHASGPQPGAYFNQGKFLPLIAMAHHIPYVATATVADLPVSTLTLKVSHGRRSGLKGGRRHASSVEVLDALFVLIELGGRKHEARFLPGDPAEKRRRVLE